jgi:hypothetical protein
MADAYPHLARVQRKLVGSGFDYADVRAYFDYFAERRLTSRGFEVRFVYDYQYGYANRGVTWATDPAIGTLAPRGSTITVYATPLDRPQPQF